jgi:ubiquinone/menaquinone biosynthesis C-methylase UbiE
MAEKHPATTQHRRNIRRFIRTLSNLSKPTGRILDVGCGYRTNEAEVCVGQEVEYITLDLQLSLKPTVVMDARALSAFQPRSFDGVICTELLEHVDSPQRVIAAIRRILKPSGIFVITVPFWKPIHENERQKDYWRFTPSGLAELLSPHFEFRIVAAGASKNSPLGVFAIGKLL